MKAFLRSLVLLTVAVSSILVTQNARADEWNKRTVMTIDESIQLPNIVLQPGTYVLKLVESPADRHIVQVFDKNETHLLTTILAIPNYRLQPTGKSVFAFWETPAGNPPALRAWFYPGDNFGQEFAYPKNLSSQIAASNKALVPTTTAQSADELKTSPLTAMNDAGQQNQLDETYKKAEEAPAAAPTPAPEPAQATAPEPTPQPEPQPSTPPEPQVSPVASELPHTASALPLVGLVGLFSICCAFLAMGRQRVR